MRPIIIFCTLMLMPSCIIVGELSNGPSWDTASGVASENGVRFTAEPNRIESHGKVLIQITAEPNLSFVGLEDIYSMGQAELLAFEAFEDRLEVLVSTKPTAQLGTMSLIFDFGEEEVHFAKDLVDIDLSTNEHQEDEPGQTQSENEQTTGEQKDTN